MALGIEAEGLGETATVSVNEEAVMSRRRGSSKRGGGFADDVRERVWEKGHQIRGRNPDVYRRDAVGNVIRKPSYGKQSPLGWQVDHKRPVDKGGTDSLRNLQPLQTEENKEKGSRYPWKR